MTDASLPLLDAWPMRPLSADNDWDRAVRLRDQFSAAIEQTLERQGVDALVLTSHTGVYPPWVRLDAWLPASGAADPRRFRGELELIIDAAPYCEDRLLVTARAARGEDRINVARWPSRDFTINDVRDWTLFALGRAGNPPNYHPMADALIGLVLAFIPFAHGPHHNPIAREFRNMLGLNGAKCLFLASVFLAWIGISAAAAGGTGVVLFVLAAAGFVGSAVVAQTRTHRIAVPDQPREPPRHLVLVDSWHTVIAGVSGDSANLKQRLMEAIRGNSKSELACVAETFSYRTPNGFERRERLVVTKGQSELHLHIYPFGDDLFVGWQAHLNCAQWGETAALSRRIADGTAIEYRDLRPTGYPPNELDLIDLSSLSGLIHRRLEQEIKRLLAERAIDQEIDFEIFRLERNRALERARQGAEPGAQRSFWGRLASGFTPARRRSETEVVRDIAPAAPGIRAIARPRFRHIFVWPATALVLQPLAGMIYEVVEPSRIHLSAHYTFVYVAPIAGSIVTGFLIWYAGAGLSRAILGTILVFLLSSIEVVAANLLLWSIFGSNSSIADAGFSSAVLSINNFFILFCYLLIFMLYIPELRPASIWVIALIIWAGGQSLLQLEWRHFMSSSSLAFYAYAISAPRAIAFAYLGYWLDRAAAPGRA